jgi:hypothetical protein
MFRSYEPGREGFVTLIANYIPLQEPFAGPNYYSPDPNALYEIHIDNDGDAEEDITYRFRFSAVNNDIKVTTGDGTQVSIPFIAGGPVPLPGHPNLNVNQTFSLIQINGPRAGGIQVPLTNERFGPIFFTPMPNVGGKTIPDYAQHEIPHIFTVLFSGSDQPGRVYAGARKDPFAVNLGEIFDLLNLDPLGARDAEGDSLGGENVFSLIMEVPTEALTGGGGDVIGGWTTAHLPRSRSLAANPTFEQPETVSSDFVQVSRLGMPLVNELVIGLKDKNLFNSSHPSGDAQFLPYVTNPSLATLINNQFGTAIPDSDRQDLVGLFLTGNPGLNQPQNVTPGEMLRLNTAIPPTPRDSQSNLGVLGGDQAGFPNGRRLGDDVVDIALRAVAGGFSQPPVATSTLPLTDGVNVDATFFRNAFPYLNAPLPGSPNTRAWVEVNSTATLRGPFEPVTDLRARGQTLTTARPADPDHFFQIRSDIRLRITGFTADPSTDPDPEVQIEVAPAE